MLVIRHAQLEAFSQAALLRFENELLAHLRQHLPAHHGQLGDAGTRDAIRYGIRRAQAYGIESERDVAHYIRHLFLFGRDFDLDPQLPWASRVLTDETIPTGEQRMAALVQAAMAWLHELTAEPAGVAS